MTDTEAQLRDLLGRARARIERYQAERSEKIAVIGLSARFPGARDLDTLWDLLDGGGSGLRAVTGEDLAAAGLSPERLAETSYVPVWGGPPEADGFDAAFFGYAPREAELLDPQQRMFLDCAWAAMEHAGHGVAAGRAVGVYAAASLSSHLLRAAGRADPFEAGLANIGGMVAARTSFHLDLRGPSVGVQTTCSSALVAIHQAIQGLRAGDCDMALAGAVAVNQSRPEGYVHQEEGIGSPDGTCRPFDAGAAGTVFANGAGAVVLKRLADALRDGDTIHGVLLGSAVNNDGGEKVGLAAPSVAGQADVLRRALRAARLDAAEIDHVEAHGTGTALGDPIEVAALGQAYGPGLEAAGRRAGLGSVKGNLGHLDAAAGMAGLVKLLLALRHGRMPGTAHFAAPNPACEFGPFEVGAGARDWPRDPDRVRRAGLSSFGIGGTNAHLILEEAPESAGRPGSGAQLLPVSARSEAALERLCGDLAGALERADAPDLAEAAFTLQAGRVGMACRRVVVAGDRAGAAAALRGPGPVDRPMAGRPRVAFVFPGQGSQAAGMARDLHAAEPVFRAALDECLAHGPEDLAEMLLDPAGAAAGRIDRTEAAQPALFAMEYALARLWMARGVGPSAMAGHSVGEFAAACLAGVMRLPDAMAAVVARGAAMQACDPGAMLAVMMSEAEAAGSLPEGVEIAAVNGPRATVLAGPEKAIAELAARLDRSGVGCRRLATSHAFHSRAMEPALAPFREVMARIALSPPQVDIVSTVTGDWLSAAEAVDPEYWVRQMRAPVRFGAAVGQLLRMDHPLLLEVGPGQALTRVARQQMPETARAVASLPRAGVADGAAEMLAATGAAWAAGAEIEWSALHDGPRRRVPLPTYPFERQSFWLPPRGAAPTEADSWTYQPVWRRLPGGGAAGPARRLVIGAEEARGLAADIGARFALAVPGAAFDAEGPGLDPMEADQYARLLEGPAGTGIDEIVLAWGLGGAGAARPLVHAALALARGLERSGAQPRLTLLGAGMQEVTGAEALDPGAAAALGLLPVLAQDVPGLACRAVDLDPGESGDAAGLAAALGLPWDGPRRIALRAGHLWAEEQAATPMAASGWTAGTGPYLIVGELAEGLAAAFARGIREDTGAPVILAGRGLPDPAEWAAVRAARPEDPATQTMAALEGLGRIGTDILVVPGAPEDADWLEATLAGIEAAFGAVAGVFHSAAMGDAAICPLGEASAEAAEAILAPRLGAVTALRRVLADRAPAFCLLQSSLSVLAGGHGFGPYAAASAAIEAEVALARRGSATVWQSVRWDAAETGSLGGAAALSSLRLLTPEEVWQTARGVLATPRAGCVAVTPGSLDARLEDAARPAPPQPETPPRRTLSTPFVAPRDAVEEAVAAALSEMLGRPEVGRDDNFFELGGHSLLAIQIVNRLRREFDVELPVRALLYEAPSVAGIAGAIRTARAAAAREADTLESLIDEVERTTETSAG